MALWYWIWPVQFITNMHYFFAEMTINPGCGPIIVGAICLILWPAFIGVLILGSILYTFKMWVDKKKKEYDN